MIRGSETDIDRVRDATDLVRLIGEHVALQPKGREHVGLCAFHDDSRPSMTVVTHKGNAFYKCHACGAAGDAFTFVMEYHRMDFGAALRFLADRAGITLSGGASRESRDGSSRAQLKAANAFAADFFRQNLRDPVAGAAGRRAVEARGIADEQVERFGIGVAPEGWDGLTRRLSSKASAVATAAEAGLLRTREDGGHYDTFRNRLIFPITDETGSVVAFGGRRLNPDEEPKYLNSPDTPVFSKSRTLYGLDLAKRAIVRTKSAIVTEGYTDVIACHQAGFDNAVSTLGTALTREHGKLLSRLCDTVILVFDGDEAGQKAADRGIEVFFAEPVDIRICVLPEDQDPDDLLGAPDGQTRFQQALDEAEEALAYKINRFGSRLTDAAGVSARQKLLESFLAELGALGIGQLAGVRRQLILARIAELLSVGVEDIDRAMPRQRPARAAAAPVETADETSEIATELYEADAASPAPRARRLAENDLLALLIYEPALRDQPVHIDAETTMPLVEAVRPESFQDGESRRLAEVVFGRLDQDETFTVQQLLAELNDAGLRRLASALYFEGERRCGDDQDGAADALAPVVAALFAHEERRRYEESFADYRRSKGGDEEALEAAREVLEQRRRQGHIASAIPLGVRSST